MYNAVFVNKDNGYKFNFGFDWGTLFDISGLSGHAVNINSEQGYAQIGSSVVTQSMQGSNLTISGNIFENRNQIKAQLLRAFAPMTSGDLQVGEYTLFCYVKSSPTVDPRADKGAFTLQLFAPYPFFSRTSPKQYTVGVVEGLFKFPMEFTNPFMLGKNPENLYINCVNGGDLPVFIDLRIVINQDGTSSFTITNMQTLESIKINGTYNDGTQLHFYRDSNGLLRLEKNIESGVEDIFTALDDETDLFMFYPGDNLISAVSETGDASYYIQLREVVSGIYENRP